MADVYEQNLASKSTLTTTDYIRVVGSDNVSYKQLVSDVAKKIIENYTGSTLAGSAQSVKSAVDLLNSNALQVAHGSGITEVAIGAYSTYSNLIFTFPNSSVTQFVFYNTGRVAILRKKADGTWGSETQIRPAD